MGIETAFLMMGAGALMGGVASVAGGLLGKKPETPAVPPVKKVEDDLLTRNKGMGGTLLTGGQGVLGQAPVAKKTMFGQ